MSERVEFKDIRIETFAEGEDIELLHASVEVTVGQKVHKSFYRYGGRATEDITRELRLMLARRIYGDVRKKIQAAERAVWEAVAYCPMIDQEAAMKTRRAFDDIRNYGDDLAEKPTTKTAV